MNQKPNETRIDTGSSNQKPRRRRLTASVLTCALAAIAYACPVGAQGLPQPVLTIASVSTNQMLISITNPVLKGCYEIESTPILGNLVDYPWTTVAVGTNGLSSYLITMNSSYADQFFMAILDTNAIPLWEAANPTNQSLGVLNVFIDSPTNNSTLLQ